ncbi:universal stress protein [Pararhizobium sp. IMCC21322]|uniref:universal stress protein n=1 Tax=Pararhizobium sp. IMCC21322 TaxID=3067903 RepID=UPI00274116E1|nr:universal stress protein [Pararhizobium sp. IMCC21322]
MPYKTIIALHNVDDGNETISEALTLCSALKAHLSVIVIGLTPQPPMSSGYGGGTFEIWGSEFARMQEEIAAKADALEIWISNNLPVDPLTFDVSHQFSQGGTVARETGRRVRFSDLCLFTGSYDPDSYLMQQTLRGALYDTGRPVLVMNGKPCPLHNLKRIMLAWDGGAQSAIAVRHALDLMTNADDVQIAMADPQSASERFGDEPGVDLATYLSRHNVPLTVTPVATEGRTVAETLVRHATDMDAELIVMGGYGHTRLQDWFLGSTTSRMLIEADRPLLLAH